MADTAASMEQVSKHRVQIAATIGGTIPRERQGTAQLKAEAHLIRHALAAAEAAVRNRVGATTAWSRETAGWRAQGALAAARLMSEAESAGHRDTEAAAYEEQVLGYGAVSVERYEQLALGNYTPTESEYARALDILGAFCAGRIPAYGDIDPAHGIIGCLVADTHDWEAEARSRIIMVRSLKLDSLKANSIRISRDEWRMVAEAGTRSLFVGYLAWTCPSGEVACCEVLGRALMGTIMADYVGAVDGELAYAFQPWVDDVGASLARLAATKPDELYTLSLAYATIAGAAKRKVENRVQGHWPRSREQGDCDADSTMWAVRWTDGAGTPCLTHYRQAWRSRWGSASLGALGWAFPSVFVFNDICDALADVQVGEAMNSVLWTASARNKGATGALGRVYGDYMMAVASAKNDEQLAASVRMYCAGAMMYDALPRYSGAAEKTRVADYRAVTDLVVTINGTNGMLRSWKGKPARDATWAEFTAMSEQVRQRLRPYVIEGTIRYMEGLLSVASSAHSIMDDCTVQSVMFELYTCGCERLPTEGEHTVAWILAEMFHCWHIESHAVARWAHHVDVLLQLGASNADDLVSPR